MKGGLDTRIRRKRLEEEGDKENMNNTWRNKRKRKMEGGGWKRKGKGADKERDWVGDI